MFSCMDHLGSKTSSPDQMIENPSEHSYGGYIFHLIIMKLYQYVCLDDLQVPFYMGQVGSKTRLQGHRNTSLTTRKFHFPSSLHETFVKMFFTNMVHVKSKTRSGPINCNSGEMQQTVRGQYC